MMKSDKHGYINNRGVSKYWGVNYHNLLDNDPKYSCWRVSISFDGVLTHLTSERKNPKLTEEECAYIAAYIRRHDIKPNIQKFEVYNINTNKRYIIDFRTNTIRY